MILESYLEKERVNMIRKRPLPWFVLITFIASTILFLLPTGLAAIGGPAWLGSVGEVLVSWGPNVAAVIVTAVLTGRSGIRQLLSGFLRWRVGWRPILLAVLGPIALIILAAGIGMILGERPFADLPQFTVPILLLTLLNHLIRGPLGEEAGWRGFALPRLQARFSPLKASLILGGIWSFWHFPFWLVVVTGIFPGEPDRMAIMFVSLAITTPALSVIMAWLSNQTQNSLFIAMLFHLFFNFANELINLPWDVHFAILAVVYIVVAIIVGMKLRKNGELNPGNQ